MHFINYWNLDVDASPANHLSTEWCSEERTAFRSRQVKNLGKWLSDCVRQIEIGVGGSPEIKLSWCTRYSENQKLYISSPILRCFMSELLRSPYFLGMTLYRRVIESRRSWGERTRAIRKVSSHFEYLGNRSGGLDVTWQPVRGDLTVHPWTVTLPWG